MSIAGNTYFAETPLDGNDTFAILNGGIPTRLSQLVNDEEFIRNEAGALAASNVYGPLSVATLDVMHLTGGLIELSHLPPTLESTTIELAPNVKISTSFENSYYFQTGSSTIPYDESYGANPDNVPMPLTHATEGSPNMPHTMYSGVTVCASNVAFSTLRDDVMPEYLRGTITLASITASTPVSSTHLVIDRSPPVYTSETSIVYTSNFNHLLPRVQVYGSNLAGYNVVAKREDFKAGGRHRTIDYFTCDPADENILITHDLRTDNINVLPIAETQHNVFPTVSVLACNVIGGQYNHFLEDALPPFLTPVKTMTIDPTNKYTSWYGHPVSHGFTTTEYASNIHYQLPLVDVKSENVHGDTLTVNSNINTSNFNVQHMVATKVTVQTNVQIINGVVSGGFLNMTSALASNVIAGVLKVTGVSAPFFPEYFREFQCGHADTGNQYSAEGDPGYGAFGGFTTDPMWVSNDEYGFHKTSSREISLEKNLKSISRYHSTKAFDDAQVKDTYRYGWNNGQRVYPSTGYTYSIFASDSIWTQNKLLISSDERIKTNVKPMNSNICLLGARCLKPSGYTHLKDGTFRLGFIAQEVREIIPEAVSIGEGTLPNGDIVNDFHVLDYNTITTINTSAIQALANEIAELKDRLRAIEDGVPRCGNTVV